MVDVLALRVVMRVFVPYICIFLCNKLNSDDRFNGIISLVFELNTVFGQKEKAGFSQ